MDYPCWLSKTQLEQAQALIDLGFKYAENCEELEYEHDNEGCWQFGGLSWILGIGAICEGALYVWECFDPYYTWPYFIDDDGDYIRIDSPLTADEAKLFDKELAQAKQAIKTVIDNQKLKQQSEAIQLSLF